MHAGSGASCAESSRDLRDDYYSFHWSLLADLLIGVLVGSVFLWDLVN